MNATISDTVSTKQNVNRNRLPLWRDNVKNSRKLGTVINTAAAREAGISQK